MDIPWALLRGHAFGDTSGLWTIARTPTVALTVSLLAVRILLAWLTARPA